MRYTQNINLPIVEDNDLYSKEINNLAFEKIDEEIQGLADIVETLDSPENSIADVKSDIRDINEQLDNNANKGVETVTGKKGIMQASVIRNSGNGWGFIHGDNVHDEINFTNVSVEGNRIRLDNKPVKLIGSTVVTPDDTLAGYGLTCGASVGTEKSYINCYAPFNGVLSGEGTLTCNNWFKDAYTINKLTDKTGFEITWDGTLNTIEPVFATTIRSGSTVHNGLEIMASKDAYNKATFRAYNDLYCHVGYDGSKFNISTSCVANIVAEWNKYNDNTLVITHDSVPNIAGYFLFQTVNVTMRTPLDNNLIHCRIERVTQTEIRLSFYNNDGSKITTPNTNIRLFLSMPGFKVPHVWGTYCRANISLGQTIVRPDKLVHANGNLWVLGLNQSY